MHALPEPGAHTELPFSSPSSAMVIHRSAPTFYLARPVRMFTISNEESALQVFFNKQRPPALPHYVHATIEARARRDARPDSNLACSFIRSARPRNLLGGKLSWSGSSALCHASSCCSILFCNTKRPAAPSHYLRASVVAGDALCHASPYVQTVRSAQRMTRPFCNR